MFGSSNDLQWGRQCSVEFRNFQTGVFTTINNYKNNEPKFRVSFEYTKSVDETKNWSNGSIKIYGLTQDTFNSVGNIMQTEITLSCGYEYSVSNPLRVCFEGVLVDKAYELIGGISVSTFTLLGYYFNSVISQPVYTAKGTQNKIGFSFPEKYKVWAAISEITKSAGYASFTLDFSGIEEYFGKALGGERFRTYVSEWEFPYGKTYYGTPRQAIEDFCDEYGLGYNVKAGSKDIIFWFLENKVAVHVQAMAIDSNIIQTTDGRKLLNKIALSTKQSILLNKNTGLKGTPSIKTKQVSKGYSEALDVSETVFRQDTPKVVKNKKGEIVKDKETGKTKMKTPRNKTVLRRSVQAICLINPSIEPQGYITLDTEFNKEINGDYRVRSVNINGDTEGSNWDMTLELESDTLVS